MSVHAIAPRLLVFLLVQHSSLFAQDSISEKGTIGIVGASMSAGFQLKDFVGPGGFGGLGGDPGRQESIRLSQLLLAYCEDQDLRVVDHSDVMFFTDPLELGRRQVEEAIEDDAMAYLGLDFLFWFGYGMMAPPESEEAERYLEVDLALDRDLQRLRLQGRGFALLGELLARTDSLVVVGDYPDMTGANPLLMHPDMIPIRRMREELNRRLDAFAAAHDRLAVFPLSRLIQRARRYGEEIELDGVAYTLRSYDLFQSDLLHPTRLGMAVLAERLLEFWQPRQDRLPLRIGDRGISHAILAAGAMTNWEGIRARRSQ